jgi:hypothetical protein
LENVGLLTAESRPAQIDFEATQWKLDNVPLLTTYGSGYVSVITTVTEGGPTWEVTLHVESAGSIKIKPINLTLQNDVRTWFDFDRMASAVPESKKKIRAADPLLQVTFTGDWDKVTDKPIFVFQGPTEKSVDVVEAPSTIEVVKQAVVNHSPPIPSQGGGGGGDDDSGGLSGGAIAGIVIGVLAAVGIVGFCVWYFVLRPKKQGVEGTKP